MDQENLDSFVRLDTNIKEFCISQCVKKVRENLNEKENKCLSSCFQIYERAIHLAVESELQRK